MSVLATTYQTVIWGSTVGTISACTNVANASYTFTIENAYSAKPKIINATNNGDYSTGTLYINSPIISSGRNTSAVAYPTLYWVVSSVVASVTGNITVIGRN